MQLELFSLDELKECYDKTALRLMKQVTLSLCKPCYDYVMSCFEVAVDACAVFSRTYWRSKNGL